MPWLNQPRGGTLLRRTVPQVQVIASRLHADDLQPWRGFGAKPHARDKPRAQRLQVSAGHLRSHGEEEFVNAAVRNELSEEGRAAFM